MRRRGRDAGLRGLLWLGAGVTASLLVLLTGYILRRGLPGLTLGFLLGQESVLEGTTGILPAIVNTLYVIVVTLAAVLPVGVGAAVYLTEYAAGSLLPGLVQLAADILAGIPSILYAMVGGIVFCDRLGLGRTLAAGALTMAVMTLPTVLRAVQESLRAVPDAWREGALGLGSGRWRMIRTVVLPASRRGVAAGCVLAVGRVVGESAVLLYTAGLTTAMQDFSSWEGLSGASGATLSAALYVYAKERADVSAAFATAAALLLLAALLQLGAAALGGGRRHD